jgi:hypothetical protein
LVGDQQIAAAIAAEGLGWTAAENELTALSPAERQGYLGLLVSPQELASFAAETAQVAAQETAAGVGAGRSGAGADQANSRKAPGRPCGSPWPWACRP